MVVLMSLSQALGVAVSGLHARQSALAVVSQNIANEGTEGYSRKLISFESQVSGTMMSGVKLDEVQRAVSPQLTVQLRAEASSLSRMETLDDYYSRVEDLFGRPDAGTALDDRISALTEALQFMATDPAPTANKQNVLNAADVLANDIRNISTSLSSLRTEADQGIADSVKKLNEDLETVRRLNDAITGAGGSAGAGINDLLDQRDSALLRINEIVGVTVIPQDNNGVAVYLPTGQLLLDGQTVSKFTFNQTNQILPGMSYTDGVSTPPYGVFVENEGSKVNLTTLIPDGKMRAYLDMRDDVLPELGNQIEDLAITLQDAMNIVHNSGASMSPAETLQGTLQIGTQLLGNSNASQTAILDTALPFATGLLEVAVVNQSTGVASQIIQIDLSALAQQRSNEGAPNNLPTMRDVVYLLNRYNDPPPSWTGSTPVPADDIISFRSPATGTIDISATVGMDGRLSMTTTQPGAGLVVNSTPTISAENEAASQQQFKINDVADETLTVGPSDNSLTNVTDLTQAATGAGGGQSFDISNLTAGDLLYVRSTDPTTGMVAYSPVTVPTPVSQAGVIAALGAVAGVTVQAGSTATEVQIFSNTVGDHAQVVAGVPIAATSFMDLRIVDPTINADDVQSSLRLNLRALQELVYPPTVAAYQNAAGEYEPPPLEARQIVAAINGDITTLDTLRQANGGAALSGLSEIRAVYAEQIPTLDTSFGFPIPSTVPGQPGLHNAVASFDSSTGRVVVTGNSDSYQLGVVENGLAGYLDFALPPSAGEAHIGMASTTVSATSQQQVSGTDVIVPVAGGFISTGLYTFELAVTDRQTGATVSKVRIDLGELQRALNPGLAPPAAPTTPVTINDLLAAINGQVADDDVYALQYPEVSSPLPNVPGQPGGYGIVGAKATIQNGRVTILSESDTYSLKINRNAVASNTLGGVSVNLQATQPATVSTSAANVQTPRQGNFSYFFGLNDFYVSDYGRATGATAASSLAVRSDLLDDPTRLSHGVLRSDLSGDPQQLIYRISAGDGTIAAALDGVLTGKTTISGNSFSSFISYAGDVVGRLAVDAANASNQRTYQQDLHDSIEQQLSSIVGVNMDEELAALITLQSAYQASARVVSAVQDMFDDLLSTVR
jgi:flagellar hook-associated protein FlgK